MQNTQNIPTGKDVFCRRLEDGTMVTFTVVGNGGTFFTFKVKGYPNDNRRDNFTVRACYDRNGDIWFNLTDISTMLGLNHGKAHVFFKRAKGPRAQFVFGRGRASVCTTLDGLSSLQVPRGNAGYCDNASSILRGIKHWAKDSIVPYLNEHMESPLRKYHSRSDKKAQEATADPAPSEELTEDEKYVLDILAPPVIELASSPAEEQAPVVKAEDPVEAEEPTPESSVQEAESECPVCKDEDLSKAAKDITELTRELHAAQCLRREQLEVVHRLCEQLAEAEKTLADLNAEISAKGKELMSCAEVFGQV